MDRSLYLYALIKTLFDKGEDFIDSFWPFVVRVASETTPYTISDIKNKLQEEFSLEIPLHVLKTIISRAKGRDYIEQKENKYILTAEGSEILNLFEDEEDVQRRINALMQDIVGFFKINGAEISAQDAYAGVNSFIQANLGSLIEYINPGANKELTVMDNGVKKHNEALLADYFIEAQTNKPQHYPVLKELVHGSIISSILFVPEDTDINRIKESKFSNCTVYLDSNIAFAVLGLTSRETNEPAQELMKLMSDLGINLKIFDFTVYQMRTIINAYRQMYDRYDPSIEVDTIHSHMQIAGWMPSDIPDYLYRLDDKFREKGVEVDYTRIQIDHEKPFNDKFEILKKYKTINGSSGESTQSPSPASLNHDLVSIVKIREARKEYVYSIENSKALFLTSDVKLNLFDFKEYGHNDAHTVAEVILDRVFANILWLKNPNIDLPLKSIIATHTKNLFVKRPVWDKFYHELKKAEQSGKITDDQVSLLFYDRDTSLQLKKFDDSDVSNIDQQFILNGVEAAEKKVKTKIEEEKNKLREEFIKKLKQTEEDQRKAIETTNLDLENKLGSVRSMVHSEAETAASVILIVALVVVFVLIVYGIYWIVGIKKVVQMNTFLNLIAVTGFSVVGLLAVLILVYKWLRPKFTEKIYKGKLKKLGLN